MSASPTQKRQKPPTPITHSAPTTKETVAASAPTLAPKTDALTSPTPRKRRASQSPHVLTAAPGPATTGSETQSNVSITALLTEDNGKKRGRTNTPWTPEEEQRLKHMRDNGLSWSEIAKGFPARTEGSVKKHWYKDMHYAEFAEDESIALREAIKEYDSNKWKAIGLKLGKPAKACEQYAREHFKKD